MSSARGSSRGAAAAREHRCQVRPRPLAQAGLAEPVDEHVVAVAVEQRVEVRERADVGGEGELEEDVAQRPVDEGGAEREDARRRAGR